MGRNAIIFWNQPSQQKSLNAKIVFMLTTLKWEISLKEFHQEQVFKNFQKTGYAQFVKQEKKDLRPLVINLVVLQSYKFT